MKSLVCFPFLTEQNGEFVISPCCVVSQFQLSEPANFYKTWWTSRRFRTPPQLPTFIRHNQ